MEFMKELLAMQKPVNESAKEYDGKNFAQHLEAFYIEQPDEVGVLGDDEYKEGSFNEVEFHLDAEGQAIRGIEIGVCENADSVLIFVTGSEDEDGNEIEDDRKYFVIDTLYWTEE